MKYVVKSTCRHAPENFFVAIHGFTPMFGPEAKARQFDTFQQAEKYAMAELFTKRTAFTVENAPLPAATLCVTVSEVRRLLEYMDQSGTSAVILRGTLDGTAEQLTGRVVEISVAGQKEGETLAQCAARTAKAIQSRLAPSYEFFWSILSAKRQEDVDYRSKLSKLTSEFDKPFRKLACGRGVECDDDTVKITLRLNPRIAREILARLQRFEQEEAERIDYGAVHECKSCGSFVRTVNDQGKCRTCTAVF